MAEVTINTDVNMEAPAAIAPAASTHKAKAEEIKPTTKLAVKYAFGCNPTKADSLLSFSEGVAPVQPKKGAKNNDKNAKDREYSDRLIYKVGKRLCVFDPELSQQVG